MLGSYLSSWVRDNHNHEEFENLYQPYVDNQISFLGIYHPRYGVRYERAVPSFIDLLNLSRHCI